MSFDEPGIKKAPEIIDEEKYYDEFDELSNCNSFTIDYNNLTLNDINIALPRIHYENLLRDSEINVSGLENECFLCFCNSILQSLTQLDYFKYLLFTSDSNDMEMQDLKTFFLYLIYGKFKCINNSNLIKQWDLSPYIQQDATEFYTFLVDYLCNFNEKFNTLYINIQSQMNCKKCGHCLETLNKYVSLSINVLDSSNTSEINELMSCEGEFNCEKCQSMQGFIQTHSFENSNNRPNILPVFYNQLTFNMDSSLTQRQNFKRRLPLKLFDDYRLKSIVFHHGSASNGHYFCLFFQFDFSTFKNFKCVRVSDEIVYKVNKKLYFEEEKGTLLSDDEKEKEKKQLQAFIIVKNPVLAFYELESDNDKIKKVFDPQVHINECLVNDLIEFNQTAEKLDVAWKKFSKVPFGDLPIKLAELMRLLNASQTSNSVSFAENKKEEPIKLLNDVDAMLGIDSSSSSVINSSKLEMTQELAKENSLQKYCFPKWILWELFNGKLLQKEKDPQSFEVSKFCCFEYPPRYVLRSINDINATINFCKHNKVTEAGFFENFFEINKEAFQYACGLLNLDLSEDLSYENMVCETCSLFPKPQHVIPNKEEETFVINTKCSNIDNIVKICEHGKHLESLNLTISKRLASLWKNKYDVDLPLANFCEVCKTKFELFEQIRESNSPNQFFFHPNKDNTESMYCAIPTKIWDDMLIGVFHDIFQVDNNSIHDWSTFSFNHSCVLLKAKVYDWLVENKLIPKDVGTKFQTVEE
eukprot:TRINITY_DN2483_c0_g1_i1.p1 TRINITY_DN2483_c0_g1~~TRINITY_DN2483_c0_g1_i1.p1  ORF type:complete len:764 (+),score=177.94 TRINITY_DN2483_c0_g1_i1:32-2293(+)